MRLMVPLLALATVLLPAPISAAAVIGGETRIAFGSIVASLDAGLTGTASLVAAEPLTVGFAITGGDLDDTLAGTIRHDGSGVTLSNGTNTLGLGNFVIDTVSSLVFGDVTLNGVDLGTGLSLFAFNLGSVTVGQLTDLDNPALDLSFTSTASNALDTAFGTGDTIGLQLGLAATAPIIATGGIPEPEAWALLVVGFAGVGTTIRLRQRRAATVTA